MLLLLIFLPITGGFIGWLCHLCRPYLPYLIREKKIIIKVPEIVTIVTILLTFGLAIFLWYDAATSLTEGSRWIQEIRFEWISLLGINFHLLLDSFAVVMVTGSLFIVLLVLIATYNTNINHAPLFYLCLLFMTSLLILFFVVSDLFLFFFCWEAISISFYFFLSFWGNKQSAVGKRFVGATKFLIYTQISALFMLISIVSLALINWNLSDSWSFDIQVLTNTPISSEVEFFLMLGFLIAFIVRIPLVPFHSWFIEAHSEASTTGSMVISGLLVNTAIYGLLRFVLPMFPNATQTIYPVMLALSAVSLFYTAFVAFNQSDIKKLFAYIHVALVAILTATIFTSSQIGSQGVVIQMLATNLSMLGLFIISRLLFKLYSTRNINQYAGLKSRFAALSSFTLFFMLSPLGLPGTANFIGNIMMLIGDFSVLSYYAMILVVGLLFISISLVVRLQPVFYGPRDNAIGKELKLAHKYTFLLSLIILVLIVIGLYPKIIIDMSYPFINQTVQHINAVRIGEL